MSGMIRRAGRLLLALSLVLAGLFALVAPATAQLHQHPSETGSPVLRSLVSVRDLDDQAWQLVAFRDGPPGAALRLRVVGYPGKVRLDHPTSLQVRSGPFQWQLEDLTLESQALSNDGRSAAAEFDLSPLLAELSQNRPLRLRLPGVFTELPVPPFVVAEWRSLVRAPA
ncbi:MULTISPECIES: DUF3122 domain-containing protein [unclassified Synechococcus]|uniref:DUF3122 domain-containing protein n=1 Tax=unclassified Synechococcus TaxID=2626047 RepID=UPI0020CE1691|nr:MULTISPECIES: DUF3122 domain-containing protein [unclassified Synechococcus]